MAEITLILIPCSGDKRGGGITEYKVSNCIINNLSLETGKRLMELRKEVGVAFQEEHGPDLGFEVTQTGIRYLEAYRRYSGNLYSKISEKSWNKLSRNSELKMLIVSALYGLVNYNELIRLYDRTMKDHIHPGRLLKTWWSNKHLSAIVLEYILQNRTKVVHDFLSTDYSHATWNFSSRLTEVGIQCVRHTYPGLGTGSDYHRGRDVNALIQSFQT